MALTSVTTPNRTHSYAEVDRYENGVSALRGIAAIALAMQAAKLEAHVMQDLAGMVRHAAIYAEQEFTAAHERTLSVR